MSTDGERDDDEVEEAEQRSGLRPYQIDENSVRVNNPDPDEPDKIIRKLATGEVKSYDVKKRK